MRNVYPLLVNKTVYEGLKEAGKEPMILTRCGFPGIQRYGSAMWSGDVGNDWETFRRQITAGLGMQVRGMLLCVPPTIFRPATFLAYCTGIRLSAPLSSTVRTTVPRMTARITIAATIARSTLPSTKLVRMNMSQSEDIS